MCQIRIFSAVLIRSIVAIATLNLLCACALIKKLEGLDDPDPFVHTVRYEGETLGVISHWYTKSSSNWKQIQRANPGLEPRMIRKGDSINIPAQLVVRTKALPKRILPKRSIPHYANVSPSESVQSEEIVTAAPIESFSQEEATFSREDIIEDEIYYVPATLQQSAVEIVHVQDDKVIEHADFGIEQVSSGSDEVELEYMVEETQLDRQELLSELLAE